MDAVSPEVSSATTSGAALGTRSAWRAGAAPHSANAPYAICATGSPTAKPARPRAGASGCDTRGSASGCCCNGRAPCPGTDCAADCARGHQRAGAPHPPRRGPPPPPRPRPRSRRQTAAASRPRRRCQSTCARRARGARGAHSRRHSSSSGRGKAWRAAAACGAHSRRSHAAASTAAHCRGAAHEPQRWAELGRRRGARLPAV